MTLEPSRRGLGRGLSALLGDIPQIVPNDVPTGAIVQVPVGEIAPHPDQPRRRFDEAALDELADSISARGVLQPIVVRRVGSGYQIVAGERRWRAAQRARLAEVPVLVRELSDAETLEIAIIENIQRQDLNAIEEAEAYKRLIDEFGHSHEALGKFINKSRSHVANLLRLLELPEAVRGQVAEGRLSMGHARALVTADEPERLADEIVRRGLSVRDAERLARTAKGAPKREPTPAPRRRAGAAPPDADLLALEQQLADMLGLSVRILCDEAGGTVTISYTSFEQLDLVCQRLSGEAF